MVDGGRGGESREGLRTKDKTSRNCGDSYSGTLGDCLTHHLTEWERVEEGVPALLEFSGTTQERDLGVGGAEADYAIREQTQETVESFLDRIIDRKQGGKELLLTLSA